MSNDNAGFSIPGVYQPNILERVGAMLQGQPDPIHKAQALDIEQKMGMMRFQQGQEELGIKKKESSRKRVNDILDFITKFDVPEEVATKIVRDLITYDPEAQSYFKGINPEEISVTPKTKGLTIEREFKEGELPDPSRPGQFFPTGRYKVEGRPGKWTSILSSKEGVSDTGDKIFVAAAKKLFPDDEVKQAEAIREFRRNPEGPQSRVFEIISKGENATPEERRILNDYKKFLRESAAERGAGAVEGATGIKSTPQYQQTEADIAGAKVTGRTEAGRKQPLGEKSASYIDPKTLVTAAPTMTEDEAMAKGFRAFRGTNAPQFITSARSAFAVLDEFEQLSKKILPEAQKGIGNIANVAKSVVSLQKRRAERDVDVVQFWALKKSALPLFARSMGDVANIAVAEQEFQATAMPNEYDTKQSAMAKISSRRKILEGVIRNALGAESPLPKPTGDESSTGEIQILRRRKVR